MQISPLLKDTLSRLKHSTSISPQKETFAIVSHADNLHILACIILTKSNKKNAKSKYTIFIFMRMPYPE